MTLMKSRLFAIILTFAIGFVIWVCLGPSVSASKKSIELHAEAISSGIATFSVALIGVMAGAVALATAIREGYWMKKFRLSGKMKEYLFYYGFTIFCLFVVHALSVYALVNYKIFRVILAGTILNTIQVMWVMYGAHVIAEKSETAN